MKASVYNQAGQQKGTVTLPKQVFGLQWNADLVHQVVVSIESNKRTPVAHTKERGDVRGGGKKPWRQKGTGRARHGSIRSPLWKGGGVTFGPRNERNYKKKINRKMKTKALYIVISRKLKDGELLFVDDISIASPKSAQAKEILTALSTIPNFEKLATKRKNTAIVSIVERDENVEKSFKNFGNVTIGKIQNLNPSDVLKYKYLVVSHPKESISFLEARSSKDVALSATTSTDNTKKNTNK
ncbi:50S ribosomal protein L4 [Patescibacteria group bacterium]|nr:50S ribosomal protein L4 [Patescibacteria group bacterium]